MTTITQMKIRNGKTGKILELARQSGVVSAADVRSRGIHHEYLRQLCAAGELVRVGRGLYSLPNADITVHHGLAQVAKAVPKGHMPAVLPSFS